MKKFGLSLLAILLFFIFMVAGAIIYSFLIMFIFKIPIIKALLNIILGGFLEHAITIGGIIFLFFYIFSLVEKIIEKIDFTCTETCMFVVGIVSTIIYSLAFIYNIISIFIGGFEWRMLIISFAILGISINVVKNKSVL